MKKILSVILVLSMVLALGVTAFAGETLTVEAGKSIAFTANVEDATEVVFSDANGYLTFGEYVIVDGTVYVNVTAPAGAAGKVAKILVKSKDGKVTYDTTYVEIAAPAEAPAPEAEAVLDLEGVLANYTEDKNNNVIYITMNGFNGISAEAYNAIKTANFDKVVFLGDDYTWTLTRGDYTKMNVTASIYFGVDVDVNLKTLNKNNEVVEDIATENAVLKALGNTKADVFYVTVADNCNIANVASKPELVITVGDNWITFNNKFAVDAYKFDGETVAKVAEGLAVKPATGKLTLNLTTAGTYVFVADNHTVAPTTPVEKPNTSTGANNAAAAVVAMAVMAVAAVASKKIVK